MQAEDRKMSPKDLQPKCQTGGNKRFRTDGSKGSGVRPLSSASSSGLGHTNTVKSCGHYGEEGSGSEPGGTKCKYGHMALGSSGGGRRVLQSQETLWAVELGPVEAVTVPVPSLGAEHQLISPTLCSLLLSRLIMFSCVNYKKGVSNLTELCFHKHCFSDVCATTLEYDFILSLVITINNLHNSH